MLFRSYRQQQLSYKKNPEEWEILGDLAERLHHPDEAVEAWQACLSMRFSPKAMRGVLGMYEQHGDHRGTLGAIIRLVAWQYRWYSEVSDCSLRRILCTKTNIFLVLTRPAVRHPQTHRRRRRGQGSQHHPSHKLAAAHSRPHPPVCGAVCRVQERWNGGLIVLMLKSCTVLKRCSILSA